MAEELFRRRVIRMLRERCRLEDEAAAGLLAWRHSRFSVHRAIRLEPWDREGVERLGRASHGERVTATALGIVNPGGCQNGVTQFRFFKDGILAQDWSSIPTFLDHPTRDAAYRVQARCSLEPACTSVSTEASANKTALINTRDGEDVSLSLRHDRGTGTTTIEWASRPQVAQVSGYDLYSRAIASSGDTAARTLSNAACLSGNIAQPMPVGTLVSRTESTTPMPGRATYYLAGHNPTTAGPLAALGRRSDNSVRRPPAACP